MINPKVISVLILAIALAACTAIDPNKIRDHVSIVAPPGDGPFPVVIFYQGGSAGNFREKRWALWFRSRGIASAIVDNAAIRGRKNLLGVTDSYVDDGVVALRFLKQDRRIDTSRYVLMGFSLGGWQVMNAADAFKDSGSPPSLVLALYPGSPRKEAQGKCYNTHGIKTRVHIFYGALDESGIRNGYMNACRTTAEFETNVSYHEIPGAYHAYDFRYPTQYSAGGPTSRIVPNSDAVKETERIIDAALAEIGWPR